MNPQKHYSGGLTREHFLFYEIRTVASMVLLYFKPFAVA
ncbi:MAG: DUF1819 family protein [Alistipes sp.]|nr:DUF1819 family protein [Alistipes sp.]